jgi:hypothetical protein
LKKLEPTRVKLLKETSSLALIMPVTVATGLDLVTVVFSVFEKISPSTSSVTRLFAVFFAPLSRIRLCSASWEK